MTIEFRCKHGFLRSHAPCEQCGDYDPSAAHDARNNRSKAQRRKAVISRHHGPPVRGRSETPTYARRERRGL
jgi:hypothetical protein